MGLHLPGSRAKNAQPGAMNSAGPSIGVHATVMVESKEEAAIPPTVRRLLLLGLVVGRILFLFLVFTGLRLSRVRPSHSS